MTRLYIYDHCPFCIRAVMVASYKQVPFERVILLNDDEATCDQLIGQKMLPVLELRGEKPFSESQDICEKLDQIGSSARKLLPATDLHKQVSDVMSGYSQSTWGLNFPRVTHIGLPEFKTEAAQAYFQGKKEQLIKESFATALSKTAQYKAEVEKMLSELPTLTLPEQRDGFMSWDDVYIFPFLRSLTLTKDLEFPEQVRSYLNAISDLTGVDLYFDRAI